METLAFPLVAKRPLFLPLLNLFCDFLLVGVDEYKAADDVSVESPVG